jgi:hypothetical protein
VRIKDKPEEEINTGSPTVEPNTRERSVNDNVNILERADESDPETVKSKDSSVFSSLDDDSTLIPLKSRHDRI